MPGVKYGGRAFKKDGKARKECCCDCPCDNCCPSMVAWYQQLLFDLTSDKCPSISGQLTAPMTGDMWSADCNCPEVSPCQIDMTCLGDIEDGFARYQCVVHMESSGGCTFDGTFQATGTCFPPDVTFNFDSGASCIGNVSVRFYSPDCDLTTCNCRCDNHCMEDDMILSAINYSGCGGIGAGEVPLSCSTPGGCTWTGSGSFGGVCGGYDFEISGSDLHNCEGQYTLKIKSGSTVVWQGKDNCIDSLCYPTALVWGPIKLPCCGGGAVKIIMSLAP